MTPKRMMFVEFFLGRANWNATEAARLAGYADPLGEGYRLKHDPEVDAAIKGRIAEAAMAANEVLHRLGEQARGNLDDFLDEAGCFDIEKAREKGVMPLLKEHSIEEVYEGGKRDEEPDYIRKVKFKLHDAQAALQLLGRHHGLFTDKTEVKGEVRWRAEDEDDADEFDRRVIESLKRSRGAGSPGTDEPESEGQEAV